MENLYKNVKLIFKILIFLKILYFSNKMLFDIEFIHKHFYFK